MEQHRRLLGRQMLQGLQRLEQRRRVRRLQRSLDHQERHSMYRRWRLEEMQMVTPMTHRQHLIQSQTTMSWRKMSQMLVERQRLRTKGPKVRQERR